MALSGAKKTQRGYKAGFDGSIVLPLGFDNDFGPLPLFTVAPGSPRGDWTWGCRLSDPTTGETLSESLLPFIVQ